MSNGFREGILIIAHEPTCGLVKCHCDPTRKFLPMPENVQFEMVTTDEVDPYLSHWLCMRYVETGKRAVSLGPVSLSHAMPGVQE